MLRYAITDLAGALPGSSPAAVAARRWRWRENLARWSAEGVGFVQLREKSLAVGEVFSLAHSAGELLGALPPLACRPRLLINGRPDLAAAAKASGVHLTATPGELTPAQAREVFRVAGLPRCLISVSCHAPAEVSAARAGEADLILFGPVFGKQIAGTPVAPAVGLDALDEACRLAGPVSVLALGGVSAATAAACVRAGAAGVAGIRIFGGTERP